jgi:hypothetical protein
MWPHERPEAHFTSHRLLLDERGEPTTSLQVNQPVDIQDFKKCADHFRGVYYGIYLKLIKAKN